MTEDGKQTTGSGGGDGSGGLRPESVPTGDLPASARAAGAGVHGDGERAPEVVGGYKILKRLGRGGMGVVYLASRQGDGLQQRVAIKLIRSGLAEEEGESGGSGGAGVVKRFELERQVLSALNHTNIARVFDAGRHSDGRPYFVMEYVEGEPIDQYCDRMQLTVGERLKLFQRVCSAVHYAHQNLVIHRDIKPSNILVDAKGEPKLMDFGIAKLINPGVFGRAEAATTGDMGPMTPEYASPEQVLGKPLGTASDVYALGVLLYEILTGRRPYHLKSRAVAEMVRVICEEDPERPSTAVTREVTIEGADGTTRRLSADAVAKSREGVASRLRRRLAGDVDNIVMMAMRKSPQRRYPSAEAMGEDIERFLNGKAVRACPETWWYLGSKFARRHAAVVIAAAAVALAVVGGGAVSAVAWQREKRARVAEETARVREMTARQATVGLARDYVGGMVKLIAPQEGAPPAMAAIADATIKTLESRAEQFGDDPEAKRLVASAYELAAAVKTGTRNSGAAEPQRALTLIEKAEAIRRSEYERTGRSPEAAGALAQMLIVKGDALKAAGSTKESRVAYEEAEKIATALGPAARESAALSRLMATALLTKGTVLEQSGDSAGAFTMYEQSLKLRRENAAKFTEAGLMRDVTVGADRVGLALIGQGRTEDGLALLRECVSIRRGLWEKEDSARTRRDWAVAVSALADAHLAAGVPAGDALLGDLELARKTMDVLSAGAPATSREHLIFAQVATGLGRVYAERRRFEEAAATLAHASEVAERAHQAQRSDDTLFLLGDAKLRLGEAQLQMGRERDAIGAFEGARALLGPAREGEMPAIGELRKRIESGSRAIK